MNNLTITCDSVADVTKEIEDAFKGIPFGNSAFQTEAFVVASQLTPARAFRAIGLQMFSKIKALREAQFSRRLALVDHDEAVWKASNDPDIFERRRASIRAEKLQQDYLDAEKLISDALEELNVLYSLFKQFPPISREAFEAEERAHFTERMNRQIAGVSGPHEALCNMERDLQALPNQVLSLKERMGLLEVSNG